MLGQCCRRRSINKPTLVQYLVLAGSEQIHRWHGVVSSTTVVQHSAMSTSHLADFDRWKIWAKIRTRRSVWARNIEERPSIFFGLRVKIHGKFTVRRSSLQSVCSNIFFTSYRYTSVAIESKWLISEGFFSPEKVPSVNPDKNENPLQIVPINARPASPKKRYIDSVLFQCWWELARTY